jgi:hypothetical protein
MLSRFIIGAITVLTRSRPEDLQLGGFPPDCVEALYQVHDADGSSNELRRCFGNLTLRSVDYLYLGRHEGQSWHGSGHRPSGPTSISTKPTWRSCGADAESAVQAILESHSREHVRAVLLNEGERYRRFNHARFRDLVERLRMRGVL